jgi:hypothetical protein
MLIIIIVCAVAQFVDWMKEMYSRLQNKYQIVKNISINYFENMFMVQNIVQRFLDCKYNLSYLPLSMKRISVI